MTTTTTATDPSAVQVHHSWVPYVAITAGAVLLLKVVLIIASEGTVADGITGPMHIGAVLLGLAAAIGAGLRRERRKALAAIGFCLLFVLYVIALSDALKPLFESFSDKVYVLDEGPLGLLGLALLGLGARARLQR